MLVSNNLETGNAAYVRQMEPAASRKDSSKEQKTQETEQAAELTLSSRIKQIAEENVLSAGSSILDVSKAEDMIRQAHLNILNEADDAVKVQSGQTSAAVMELLK